jgi:hypothetical protein
VFEVVEVSDEVDVILGVTRDVVVPLGVVVDALAVLERIPLLVLMI